MYWVINRCAKQSSLHFICLNRYFKNNLKMSKRKLDLGDVGSAKSIRAGESSSIKPGLKMNTYNGLPYTHTISLIDLIDQCLEESIQDYCFLKIIF